MKVNIGDYLIETDERQFIVKVKKVVEESRLTKEENIGKEYYQAVAYCTTFNSALKFVPQHVLRSNQDILVIIEKLEQIERDIKEVKNNLNIAADEIVISKEDYESLERNSEKLNALECGGVDNWEGYGYAMSEFYLDDEEDED